MFPGLSDTVTVYEDPLGIPTIKATTAHDALFMQGYMHARDRFFQMDRDRKGAAGRAAEMFGESALPGAFGAFGFNQEVESAATAQGTFAQSLLEASGFGHGRPPGGDEVRVGGTEVLEVRTGASAEVPLTGHVGMIAAVTQHFGQRSHAIIQMPFVAGLADLVFRQQFSHVA